MLESVKHVCGVCRARAERQLDRLLKRERPKRLILVVDDEPDIVDFLGALLEAVGYEAVAARDGYEALRLAKELRPELILMNLLMPGMNGLEALESLHRDPVTRNMKVVMHSAHQGEGAKARARASGALGWLVKPFGGKELFKVVERALAR